jgi:hypothetical protein
MLQDELEASWDGIREPDPLVGDDAAPGTDERAHLGMVQLIGASELLARSTSAIEFDEEASLTGAVPGTFRDD